jgi:hypothetical protein
MSRTARFLRTNTLGVIAIVIALSAGAYAVDKAPKDSVVSSSIKNGQVKAKDIRASAVDGSRVKDGSLTGADINESTLDIPAAPTYEAGNSLQLVDGTFSVSDGGIGGLQINDGSLSSADLGFTQSASIPSGNLATGLCAGVISFAPILSAPGSEGDFTITTTVPAMPAGVITSGRIGPVSGGFRQYVFDVCNLTGGLVSIPNGTITMLVISQ